ncbi:MAG TPA: glucose-6-phosphate isomerase, partial [Bdellovibrionales bacterium]|nr:glucose-6-phosphate isomerase [Bdellovibrionales bacterium]
DGLAKLRARRDLGFLDLPNRQNLWTASRERSAQVAGTLAVLGIGGSSLGGRALMDAFASKRVVFFENVDAKDFWARLEALGELKNVHWAIVSKSGNTIETLGQASFVSQRLEEQGLKLKDRATVITELRSNPLHDWAKANGVPVLEIPLDVGGRFSVLSPVGMFPAAAAGLDIEKIREGALWALKQDELIGRLMAHSLKSFERGEFITLFWVYCNRLWTWGLWVQQLWAESLAKKTTRKGAAAPRVSTPIPLIGANDQHSVLQQVAEGARDKFIWFLRSRESETAGPSLKRSLFAPQGYLEGKGLGALLSAEAQATAKALQQNQVQSLTLEVERVDERTLGALLMLLEVVVGAMGETLDINAFDQPGVELGKRLALEILK